MKKGLIVYNKEDQIKNQWFIDRCLEELNSGCFSLFYKEEGELLSYLTSNNVDFVIYRGRDYLISKKLEELGIRVFNNSKTNQLANNKYETFLFLKENGIPCVESFKNIKDVNKYPLITKSVSGHGGQEVFLLRSPKDETRLEKQKEYIFQRYIENVSDVRLYVLGGQIIGAVKRENNNDFRSNYSLGGKVSKYDPSLEMKEVALKVSKLLNADYIGVDFFLTSGGFLLNEIEDPVGARMLYATSGIDAISLFITYIKTQLQ